MRKNSFVLAGLISVASLGLVACDVEKTSEGNLDMPNYEVTKTDDGSAKLPSYNVETPEVNVSSTERQVTVPDVDVKTEERTVTLPKVDITPAGEGEANRGNNS